jgi:uncharacterized protein
MKSDEIKILINYRMEQAHIALEDAKVLLANHRPTMSTVNRLYYAMFYAVSALLQTIGKVSSKHSGAISLFDREFVKPGTFPRSLSEDIHEAFDLRQKSDYHVPSLPTLETAVELCQKAEQFVEAVRRFLSEQGWL